jgi:hypothetical protein
MKTMTPELRHAPSCRVEALRVPVDDRPLWAVAMDYALDRKVEPTRIVYHVGGRTYPNVFLRGVAFPADQSKFDITISIYDLVGVMQVDIPDADGWTECCLEYFTMRL